MIENKEKAISAMGWLFSRDFNPISPYKKEKLVLIFSPIFHISCKKSPFAG